MTATNARKFSLCCILHIQVSRIFYKRLFYKIETLDGGGHGGTARLGSRMRATAAAERWHGEIVTNNKQGLIFIETWNYAKQYLVFDTYYLLYKSCFNLFMI